MIRKIHEDQNMIFAIGKPSTNLTDLQTFVRKEDGSLFLRGMFLENSVDFDTNKRHHFWKLRFNKVQYSE